MAGDYLKFQRGRERFEVLEADGHYTFRVTGAVAPIVVADFELTPDETEKLRGFLSAAD